MVLDIPVTIWMRLEKLFFRLQKKIVRAFFHTLKQRPSSFPYLTGDSFRNIADHIHDETQDSDPRRIQRGDVVFVSQGRLPHFFAEIHPHITTQYILLCHNGDRPQIDPEIAHHLDEKIIRFYAQCVLVAHEKIVPIPIGIENKHHGTELYSRLIEQKNTVVKKPRIFFHFSIQTNPTEREPAHAYFMAHPLMDTIDTFVPYKTYKNLLASYCFTVSPAGNTLGSHRTWEAIYLRTIPIVKRTADAEACAALKMPLWIVDDWRELDNISEKALAEKYNTIMSNASYDALFMDYWIKRIRRDQELSRAVL